jgi:hypothetical protein
LDGFWIGRDGGLSCSDIWNSFVRHQGFKLHS